MPTILRSWLAFAAVGAGLIHCALVIGSPIALAIPLAILGLIEFAWGVLVFSREIVPFPRVAIIVAFVPVITWGVLLAFSAGWVVSSLGLLPLAVSTLFELVIATALGVHLRRGTLKDAPPPFPSVGRYLLGLGAGALVVAALTTPALAATEAGTAAVPPGDVFELPGHDGH